MFTVVTSARDICDAMRNWTAVVREVHGRARKQHIRVIV